MQGNTQAASASTKMVWAGRVVSALPALMLVFSAVLKLASPQGVTETFSKLGWNPNMAFGLGILELDMHGHLFDSADIRTGRDLADRLPWGCGRNPRANQRFNPFDRRTNRVRRAGLVRPLHARCQAARPDTAAKLIAREGSVGRRCTQKLVRRDLIELPAFKARSIEVLRAGS